MRIGYLVPEFPGQTHIFFWRELKELHLRSVETDLVSTRRPAAGVISHVWSEDAQRQTTYLNEGLLRALPAITRILLKNFRSWRKCLMANDGSLSKVRQAALILLGARLAAMAQSRKWQHVHVHSCADSANIALFAFLLSGLPYSLMLHGPLNDYGGNQPQKWQHARFAIVITQLLFRELTAQINGSLPRRTRVCAMGVDTRAFVRKVPYRPWTQGQPLRIFSCARLNPCKGHIDLINAVGVLRRTGVDARLTIAGQDEQGGKGYRNELSLFVKQLGLDPYVKLQGAVSEHVIRSELENCHVFALLSLAEPLGVAIMEAMAMEVPVVATSTGGVPELITDGKDGVLVAPRDADAAAAAILDLVTDFELSATIGTAARHKIVDKFECSRSAEVLLNEIRR